MLIHNVMIWERFCTKQLLIRSYSQWPLHMFSFESNSKNYIEANITSLFIATWYYVGYFDQHFDAVSVLITNHCTVLIKIHYDTELVA